jgi:hypothetical protein
MCILFYAVILTTIKQSKNATKLTTKPDTHNAYIDDGSLSWIGEV